MDESQDVVSKGRLDGYYARSWRILAIAWLAYCVDVFMRYNIPTVMPILRQTYHWSASTMGWVDSAYLWAYALTQIPWGYVSEKWIGARWTVSLGTAMIALASVAFAFHVSSLWLGITARAIIGAGAAAIWVPLNPALARWFAPRHRGLQTGILGTASPVGTLLGGGAMPFLLTGSVALFGLSTLQSGFLWSAIPGLIITVLVPLVIRNRPEDLGLASLDNNQTVTGKPMKEPGFGHIMSHSWYPYILALVYAGYLGSLYFVWTWFAAFLNSAYGIDVRSAGLLWAFAATVPAVVSQPVGGYLSDRLGRSRTVRAALVATTICSLLFVVFALLGPRIVPWWAVISLTIVFTLFVNMWVLVWPFTTLMFPTKAGGAVGGFMNTVGQLVGASAPVVSGYLLDATGSYVLIFLAGAVCALIGFFASFWLKEYRVI
ncbi:MFS transporter [Paraburkholderia sp. J12]|uniref:MFS transporter n=1 Tax=Paraburkholderia sp. J12 TaxID=2805432 RepID=UPI002ABE487A|nr:MFS transporter [Paraburkholderia sp. J12]